MRSITGWMVFDTEGELEVFKMQDGTKGCLVFKTLKEAQKHAKEDYQVSRVTINKHKMDYNMNVTPTKKQPIKTPPHIRK